LKGWNMIDNYAEAMELMRKMEAQLPIPVHLNKMTIKTLREKGIKISSNQIVPVNSLVYLGDEGGIGCEVQIPGDEKNVVIVSLTHVRVIPDQPLTKDIWAYQLERSKKLAERDGLFKPFEYTVKPSKKRKKKKK
jgi:hypothetical protein